MSRLNAQIHGKEEAMIICQQCGAPLVGDESFCHKCGGAVRSLATSAAPSYQSPAANTTAAPTIEYLPPEPGSMARQSQGGFAPSPAGNLQVQGKEDKAAAGLAQMFGLDPRVALVAVVLDTMLFVGETLTFEVLLPFSVLAGAVFGFITYKAQKSWYGDDHDSALIKGLIMGLLTAIPTSLPAFLYVPAGFLGLANLLRKKKN
jgi:phage shock protein PspC (stress-responsive transcriptional regulator)